MDPLTILAMFGPLAVDLGKSLISRFLAPDEFKPTNVDEYARMRELDLQMFQAMNSAGGSNPTYPWVEAVVRLMRPGIALAVVGTWCLVHGYLYLAGENFAVDTAPLDNFASAVGFYLFGDRSLFYSKKSLAKIANMKQ